MILFNNAIDIASYDDAYMALSRISNFETYIYISQWFALIVVNEVH